jgi:hypothetical protein
MAQTIKLKRSATQGTVPSTGQLELGEVAINTYDGKMYIKKDNGTQSIVEVGLADPTSSVYTKYIYTATSAQTTFTGSDDNSGTLSYSPGFVDVYLNGVKLIDGTEYTATNRTSIVLAAGTSSGDIVQIVAMGSAAVENLVLTKGVNTYAYTATASQTTFSGSDNNSATLAYTVNQLQVYLNGVLLDSSDYTATNGTSIVLATGAAAGTSIVICAFYLDEIDILGTTITANAFIGDGSGLTGIDGLPSQTGNAGKYLTTNGSVAAWDELALPEFVYTRTTYTATASQTTFNATYTIGYVDVYLNGIKLLVGTDFTATNGTSIVVSPAVAVGDIVEIIAHTTYTTIVQVINSDGGFANSVYTSAQSINGGSANG